MQGVTKKPLKVTAQTNRSVGDPIAFPPVKVPKRPTTADSTSPGPMCAFWPAMATAWSREIPPGGTLSPAPAWALESARGGGLIAGDAWLREVAARGAPVPAAAEYHATPARIMTTTRAADQIRVRLMPASVDRTLLARSRYCPLSQRWPRQVPPSRA